MVGFGVAASLLTAAFSTLTVADLVPGAYIFEFADGQDGAGFLGAVKKHGTVRLNLQYDLFKGVSVQLSDLKNAEDIASELMALPGVKNMWPVESYTAPKVSIQWVGTPGMGTEGNLRARGVNGTDTFSPHVMTQVDKLRAKGITGKGIKVGVIDTGIDYSHPALGNGCFGSGCLVARGYDFVGDAYDGTNTPVEDNDPMDCAGHGSHVAGIIAAQSNKFGFTGAAPDVTLGAYRVFGCNGDTEDDVMLAALARAYQDGNDIITMSIGGPGGWSEHPWSVAVSRIVDKGIPCTVSAGNDGEKGLFYADGAADGRRVASIAAFENTIIPALLYNISYTVNGGDRSIVGYYRGDPNQWVNVSLPLWTGSTDAKSPSDACQPFPDDTPDLSKYIVLIRQGGCSSSVKAANAQAKGARYLMLYNNAPGVTGVDFTDVKGVLGAGMVTAETGEAWVDQLKEGKQIVLNMTSLNSEPYLAEYANPVFGGAPDTFTSWGPTWDMDVKPQFGAPGGSILSTYPVKKGGYAVMDGTSMSCPLTAAIYALIGQVRGKMDPSLFENLLSANSDPGMFNDGSKFFPYLAPVAQQGGGLIRAYDAAYATTLLEPSSLSFNDTDAFINVLNFTISNKNAGNEVTYSISHVPTISMYTLKQDSIYPQAFPNDAIDAPATLKLSEDKVTIKGGDSVTIEVMPTPPKGLDASRLGLWSGYVAVNGSDGTSLSIPYQGLTGSLRNATVLDSADTWITQSIDKNLRPLPGNTSFELSKNASFLPAVVVKLALGSPLIRLDLMPVSVPNGTSTSTFWDYDTIGQMAKSPVRWKSRGNVVSAWAGKLASGKYAPEGTYKIVTRALRIRGDEKKKEDYDVSVSPAFSITYV